METKQRPTQAVRPELYEKPMIEIIEMEMKAFFVVVETIKYIYEKNNSDINGVWYIPMKSILV